MMTPAASSELATIVMYHFVRPAGSGAFPRLPALDVAAFREQLDYVCRYHSPVPLGDLADAAQGLTTLPKAPVAFTFDDGYVDHFRYVFPELKRRRLPATFFPVRSALVGRIVLDVNKVQFVLASQAGLPAIVDEMEQAIRSCDDPSVESIAEYRAKWCVASAFDIPEVVYVKRLLQHALPASIRRPLLDGLFRRFVTADEASFAADLYLSVDQAREMLAAGMVFGGHADRHIPLSTLSRGEQSAEIDGALEALAAIGAPRDRFAYSYVKGEFTADSVDLLRSRGCGLAVTNKAGLARPTAESLFVLPRLDTNHLPTDRNAPPNAWTTQALA
jgi:peptidoglycan/xylan/chitin deacetylase (PgdA/CDA1 family)